MQTQTRARKVAATNEPTAKIANEPPFATLLARCARSSLEDLLSRLHREGLPPTRDDVLSILPGDQHGPLPQLETGIERTNTGGFDLLPSDLLNKILLRTGYVTRLMCATRVCKAWRTLKQQPALWSVLKVGGPHYNSMDSFINVDDYGFTRLLATIDPTFVRKLYLDNDGQITIATTKQALSRFTGLEELHLVGMCEYYEGDDDAVDRSRVSEILRHVVQQPWIKTLKKLDVSHDHARLMRQDVVALICAASGLEKITLPVEVADASTFAQIAASWQWARGGLGAIPLLNELSISLSSIGGAPLIRIVHLGSLFPDLRVLTWRPNAFEVNPMLTFAPMTSLRELSLERYFVERRGHQVPTTQDMRDTLCKILDACPNLTRFSLRHGKCRGLSFDSYPGVGDALTHLPRTLERLTLHDIRLQPGDLIPGNLPALKSLWLGNCGGVAHTLKQPFKEQMQSLLSEKGSVVITA